MMRLILSVLTITLVQAASIAQYTFSAEKMAPCTEIKNQQKTGTCWSFATTSFLESEAIRMGQKDIDLSEMYVVHNIYKDKAANYVLRQGKANFSQGALAHDLIRAVAKHGVIPESVYSGRDNEEESYNHSELEKGLKGFLDGIISAKKIDSYNWQNAVDAILDVYMGDTPESFAMGGDMKMTAETYARKLKFDVKDYVNLSSFSHHPFYNSFILEVPDNYSNGSFYNLPIDDFMNTIEFALMEGYTVAWDGDVSEKGFSSKNGLAILPVTQSKEQWTKPVLEQKVTQQSRQDDFMSFNTTDDHLMHMIGVALDQKGNKYFIIKNSWGEVSDYKGFLYMSEAYVRAKTVAVLMHKDAIPAPTSKKLFKSNK
jgi:bleomycin hydrolase